MDKSTEKDKQSKDTIVSLPAVEHFVRTYANKDDVDDRKWVHDFVMFEATEKKRRLKSELQWVINGLVPENICDRLIGKKRSYRYESYKRWAELMLIWIAQTR